MTPNWTTELTEHLTLAWADSASGPINRGTSATARWTVGGILGEAASDALRHAVRERLDHQPVTGAVGVPAVAEVLRQTIVELCSDRGLELQVLELTLEHGYQLRWERCG